MALTDAVTSHWLFNIIMLSYVALLHLHLCKQKLLCWTATHIAITFLSRWITMFACKYHESSHGNSTNVSWTLLRSFHDSSCGNAMCRGMPRVVTWKYHVSWVVAWKSTWKRFPWKNLALSTQNMHYAWRCVEKWSYNWAVPYSTWSWNFLLHRWDGKCTHLLASVSNFISYSVDAQFTSMILIVYKWH